MERLNGIGVSPGVAVGRAAILTLRTEAVRFPIPPDRVEREIALLQAAREQSRHQLQEIRARIAEARGAELAAIFDAQILMLDDPSLVGRAEQIVREEQVNAAWAVHRTYEELGAIFSSVETSPARRRPDVAGRFLNLRHGARSAQHQLDLLATSEAARPSPQLDWTFSGLRRRRGQPHITRRSRGRSRCPQSSACTFCVPADDSDRWRDW